MLNTSWSFSTLQFWECVRLRRLLLCNNSCCPFVFCIYSYLCISVCRLVVLKKPVQYWGRFVVAMPIRMYFMLRMILIIMIRQYRPWLSYLHCAPDDCVMIRNIIIFSWFPVHSVRTCSWSLEEGAMGAILLLQLRFFPLRTGGGQKRNVNKVRGERNDSLLEQSVPCCH